MAYFAMEWVDGQTLREMMSAGRLAMRRVLNIAQQTADGLAKAHAAGIVHRDLKPENLMLTADGFVRIVDFGISKLEYFDVRHYRFCDGEGDRNWYVRRTDQLEQMKVALRGAVLTGDTAANVAFVPYGLVERIEAGLFISTAATGWATLALAYTLEEKQ